MALILRAYASAQKVLLRENFGNLLRTRTCITHNGFSSFKRFPAAAYNVRHLSTKNPREAPTEKTEIYYGSLTKQIRNLKLFTLLTSAGGLIAQPFFYTKVIESGNMAVIGVFMCIGLLATTTPLMIHIILKKYVTRLYYDPKEDKYIANTYSLFVQTKELEFTPDDVVVPDVSRIFANCIIKGNPLFLEQKFFYDSSHYIRIMGFDKPIDYKLNSNNDLDQTVAVNAEHKDVINKK